MMNKEQKKNYITEMTANFENSEAVLVTHYQGLTVKQLDELRKQMRDQGIQFKITKNRITKLALEKTKCKDLANLFTGPTAVALSKDAISSAKILTKFSKENSNLKILDLGCSAANYWPEANHLSDIDDFTEDFKKKNFYFDR